MMNVTRGAGGEIVIRIDGTFDPQAALRLSGRLGEVPAGAEVIVDFSRARELQDLGLAMMAASLWPGGLPWPSPQSRFCAFLPCWPRMSTTPWC